MKLKMKNLIHLIFTQVAYKLQTQILAKSYTTLQMPGLNELQQEL
jgi:hypothetical protein